MVNSEAIELARAQARKWKRKRARAAETYRWNRASEEIIEGETIAERRERLTAIYWDVFGEAPSFNRNAPSSSPLK